MSREIARSNARSALERMNLTSILINPTYGGLVSDFNSMLGCSDDDYSEHSLETMKTMLCEAYGYSVENQDKLFAFANGTAIIPVHGTLINRYGGYYFGYITGYNFIRRLRNEAMADPDVERIVYDINSNGGEAAGCFELSRESFDLRGTKPTIAVVDSNCYSAAYAFASSADKIIATPSGGAGSIGVLSMHVNVSKMLERMGVEITLIPSGKHKVDGHPYGPLPKDVLAERQASGDKTYSEFINLVATNRSLDPELVRGTEARCYDADDALALGLIDEIATPTVAISNFINSGQKGPNPEETSMTKTTTAPVQTTTTVAESPVAAVAPTAEQLASAKTDGQQAERNRISGIQTCEAAKGRTKLANYLAFNTSMSVEEATAILSASSTEEQATASKDTTPSAFAAAMSNGNPEVGSTTTDMAPDGSTAAAEDKNPLLTSLEETGFNFNK